MPAEYLDTSALERDDDTLAQLPALDYSIVQPFASPSKNPADDLKNKMRGLRTGALQQPPIRTPRVRNALVDRRNPAGHAKQEFTPLLRSAKRKELLRQSIMEEKENLLADVPETPAGFRSSYGGDATQLPMNSSMIDGESSIGHGGVLPEQHAVSSSMLSVTPMPTNRENGVLEQGNVLSLRDQEAKLDQIQKDNFGLKLKIHFLEETLRKSGNEFQQEVLKENAQLKTDKFTAEADLRAERKRTRALEKELETSQQKYTEMSQSVKSSRGSEQLLNQQHAEQIAELERQADEAERLAEQRLGELEDLRAALDEAETAQEELQKELEQTGDNKAADDQIQALKDDVDDLEREVRDRDARLDARAEEIEGLQAELRQSKAGDEEAKHLKDDIAELEAELKDKDAQLDAKDEKIAELEEQANEVPDRERSAKRHRFEVLDLETKLRDSEQGLDEANEEVNVLRKQLKTVQDENVADIEERDAELDELEAKVKELEAGQADVKDTQYSLKAARQQLIGKDGEIRNLEERLQTARGSWDAEAHQTDARIQEKDRAIQERDDQLRQKSRLIEQRDDELNDLQKRLRIAERRSEETSHAETGKLTLLRAQLTEATESARAKEQDLKTKLKEKDDALEEHSAELRHLHRLVTSLKGSEAVDAKTKNAEIDRLEETNRNLVSAKNDQARRISELESRLHTAETPSRRDASAREHRREMEALQASLKKFEQQKKDDLASLESELNRVEKDNLRLRGEADQLYKLRSQIDTLKLDKEELQRKVDRANDRIQQADGDQSMLGHQSDELSQSRSKILLLEDELDQLQSNLRRQQAQSKQDLERLRTDLSAKHSEAKQALEDELIVLEASLDEADAQRVDLTAKIAKLEADVKCAREAKINGTPARERKQLEEKIDWHWEQHNYLSGRVDEAETELATSQEQVVTLQSERDDAQGQLKQAQQLSSALQAQVKGLQQELDTILGEKTLAVERADLHELVKKAKIEAEEMQIKLSEREKKLSASSKRESELRGQLDAAQLEVDDLQCKITEVELKLNTHMTRETELRTQLAQSREAKQQVEDLELQLGDRNTSSSGHARREAELRIQLRDAKIALDGMQNELAEKEDRMLTLMKREHGLRERLRKVKNGADDTLQGQFDVLQAQLDEADEDVSALQRQLQDREKLLSQAQQKEVELRHKIKLLQTDGQTDGNETRHRQEIRGLATQIKLLRARCAREESFRTDLIYTKRWFLMQVATYNECNQADLRLLEDMGIAADQTIREKRPTLRSAGLTILAAIRMQKMSAAWSSNKQLQKELERKVKTMKRAPRRKEVY